MDLRTLVSLFCICMLTACSNGGDGGPAYQEFGYDVASMSENEVHEYFNAQRVKEYGGKDVQATLNESSLTAFSKALLTHIRFVKEDNEIVAAASEVSLKRSLARFGSSKNSAVLKSGFLKGNALLSRDLVSGTQDNSAVNSSTIKGSTIGGHSLYAASFSENSSSGLTKETIHNEYDCELGGSVYVRGNLYTIDGYTSHGAVNVSYKQCHEDGMLLDGKGAELISEGGEFYRYFNQTSAEIDGRNLVLTGSIFELFNTEFFSNLAVLDVDTQLKYQIESWDENSNSSAYDGSKHLYFNGKLFHPEHGFVFVSSYSSVLAFLDDDFYSAGAASFEFANNLSADLTLVSDDKITIAYDEDGDRLLDKMAIVDPLAYVLGGAEIDSFVPYVAPNFPPVYGSFEFASDYVDTTQNITAILLDIHDPENDPIEVSYLWSVNGVSISEKSDTLTALTARKNDVVTVTATLNDGSNQVQTKTLSLTVGDAPPAITFEYLPAQINSGEALLANVVIADPDIDDSSIPATGLSLEYGPADMNIVGSQLQWTAPNLSFSPKMEFFFGLSGSGGELLESSVLVSDDNKALPIVRTGIEVPKKDNSIIVGQFDDDVATEILVTDNLNLIYTLEHDGSSYRQEWVYPYVLDDNPIANITSVDQNNDGKFEIVAATSSGVYLIEGPDKMAKTLYQSVAEGAINALASFTNLDGNENIAVLTGTNLIVLSLEGEVLKQISVSDAGFTILAGEVDGDSAPEIILSGGYVYDSETLTNEWFYPSGFGSVLELIDVDDDSVSEILGASGSLLSLYSAESKAVLWQESADIGRVISMDTGDVIKGGKNELVIGNTFDGVAVLSVDQMGYSILEHSSSGWYSNMTSITVGDLDNDGVLELIGGTGTDHSGVDELIFGEVDGANFSFENDPNLMQLFSLVAAGFAKVSPEHEKAIFLAPKSGGERITNSGQRIVQFGSDGLVEISDELASNWDNAGHAEVADYDDDGFAEVFVSSSQTYDGFFQVLQLSDYTSKWLTSSDYDNDIGVNLPADLNNDGYMDAIYANSRRLVMADVYNQVLLWESARFDRYIKDVAVVHLSGEEYPAVLVSTEESLSLLVRQANGSYSTSRTFSANGCDRIEVAQADKSDGQPEIFCLKTESYYFSDTQSIQKLDQTLALQETFDFNFRVTDILLDERNSKALYLATTPEDGWSHYEVSPSTIKLMSTETGKVVFSTPGFIGQVSARSMYQEVTDSGASKFTFATRNAMYLTQ